MRKFVLLSKNPKKVYISSVFLIVVTCFAGCVSINSDLDTDYLYAKKAYQRTQYKKALEYYRKYMNNNPEGALREVSLYYIAKCYEQTGEDEKAKTTYKELIEEYKEGYWVEKAQKSL